jgi:hypothetical protein
MQALLEWVHRSRSTSVPTFGRMPRFVSEYLRLKEPDRKLFLAARDAFVRALLLWEAQGCRSWPPPFPDALQVQDVKIRPGTWELTWEKKDGRCTWEIGDQVKPGKVHIVWRRIGGHGILKDP